MIRSNPSPVEYSEEPKPGYVCWGDENLVQKVINHLNSRQIDVQPPEYFADVNGVKGWRLELKSELPKSGAEEAIKDFNPN